MVSSSLILHIVIASQIGGNGFGDDALTDLLDFADKQNLVFVANRADDDWFDNQSRSMQVHYFDITYTAGRRKKTEDGFAAKKQQKYYSIKQTGF